MLLPKLSIAFLQAVIVIQFILTVWSNQCTWLPESYQFCNFLVLGVGVGAVVASSNNAIAELFLSGMAFGIVHDIIVLATFYEDDDTTPHACAKKDHFRFSFGVSILNLLFKPVSCMVIFLNYLGRSEGGLKQKVVAYCAGRGAASEPPNEALPPQQAPPPY